MTILRIDGVPGCPIHRARDSKQYLGVEFLSPETNFWHMQFPLSGAKPLRRAVPTKASA